MNRTSFLCGTNGINEKGVVNYLNIVFIVT